MTASQHRLVVDFGTSTTIAMLQRPDGRVQSLIFDGSPLLSSAVLLGPDGQLHTGRDAAHLARSAPERLEPNPKRRIDETAVLLGDREVDVRDLIAAVLSRVATEAARVAGPVLVAGQRDLTLTHPAAWGPGRRAVLLDAAQRAGFGGAELVSEPLAAATYFARIRGGGLPVGACVLVYDLGGGTCDVTVLRRQPGGFQPIASDGLNDVGGLDVDAAVVAFLQATYGELWTSPATRRQVWEDVRSAKEMLSRASSTVIMIPALQKEVPLGREQLEGLTRPVLRGTVSMTRTLLVESNIAPDAIAGLFLVGGSSRIPLVATLLHEALGIAPVVAEQPELVVAEGALSVRQAAAGAPAGPVTSAPPSPVSPMPGVPVSPMPGVPVSPMPISSMPVSPMPASPVSPNPVSPLAPMPGPVGPTRMGANAGPSGPSGPVRPMPVHPGPPPGPPFGGPPVMPPRPPVPPRSGSRGGGFIVAIVAGVIVVVLLVIGVPVTIYTMANKTNTARSGSPVTANRPSNAATSSGTSPGTEQTGAAASGKYDIQKIPENLCGVVDISAVAALFEADSGTAPNGSRQLSTIFGSATCILSRQHNNSAKVPLSVGTLSFSLYVFADQSAAESNQKQTLDNAKLNAATTDVPGLGDTAFVYQVKTNTANPGSEASYTLEARDGNLRWTASVIGSRIDSVNWSDADRKDLQNRLISMAKASFAKVTSGMK